jgi:hypothetical protein
MSNVGFVDVYGGGLGGTSVYTSSSDTVGSKSVDPTTTTTTAPPVVPPVICDDSAKIEELLVLIDTLYAAIDKLFPLIRVVAKQHSQLSVTSHVIPPLYVRLVWIEQHKRVRFIGSLVQLLQLKDIYYALGEDWKQDKILVARLPAEYQ